MDLSTIEGLTEEQRAAITDIYDSEHKGLVSKASELLSETKTAKQANAELQDKLSATLKANGDMEGLKAHYEEQAVIRDSEEKQRAIKDAEEKQALKNTLLNRDKEVILNKTLNLIHDDFKGLATAQLEKMIDVVYNDEGQPVYTFKTGGEVVANNVAEFEGWALEQDTFKRILNGVNSSGANTVQTRASGSTGGDTVQNRLAQRLKNHGL